MSVALGAALGLAAGFVAGFAVAILQLRAKHLRNARLIAQGLPPRRDAVLVKWHLSCGPLGALGAGALATWLPLWQAVVAGALALPTLLLLALGLGAIQTLVSGR